MEKSTNFIMNFDPLLVVVILVAASVAKIGAVIPGAKAARLLDREVCAIGFGLNTRGANGGSSSPESGWPRGSSTPASLSR
jgi:hypothetical protein